MSTRITLIHTVPTLADRFRELLEPRLPTTQIDDVVIEELLQRTIAEGQLTDATRRQLASAVRAVPPDTDAILVTCSSLGSAVDALAGTDGPPVLRVDEPMARRALAIGTRIGVLATLSTTMEPTTQLLRRVADEADTRIQLVERLCEGAFEAAQAGETERHDRLVRDGLQAVLGSEVDVVVLAQASMARVVDTLPEAPRVPVLASPPLAVDHLVELLGQPDAP